MRAISPHMVFRPSRRDFFLASRQLCQLIYRFLRSSSGRSLGAVSLGFLPLPTLGGVPELPLQLFCSRQKSAPEEFLRRGLNLFFCTF